VNKGLVGSTNVYCGKGCDYCNYTGFYGRIAIFEVLPFTPKIREIVSSKVAAEEIRASVQHQMMSTMGEDGAIKVKNGITTAEEVLRVIELEEDVRLLCLNCENPIQTDFVMCPHCKDEIQQSCLTCNKVIQSSWIVCPYCRAEI
jgi:hypothetical protein